MKIDDISRAMEISAERAFCVLTEHAQDYPGYIRSIFIRPRARVTIEFEVYGVDEGGAYFVGEYSDLHAAIEALEKFIGKSIDDWDEMAGCYPERNPAYHLTVGHSEFEKALKQHAIALPGGAEFTLRGSDYWKSLWDQDISR